MVVPSEASRRPPRASSSSRLDRKDVMRLWRTLIAIFERDARMTTEPHATADDRLTHEIAERIGAAFVSHLKKGPRSKVETQLRESSRRASRSGVDSAGEKCLERPRIARRRRAERVTMKHIGARTEIALPVVVEQGDDEPLRA